MSRDFPSFPEDLSSDSFEKTQLSIGRDERCYRVTSSVLSGVLEMIYFCNIDLARLADLLV